MRCPASALSLAGILELLGASPPGRKGSIAKAVAGAQLGADLRLTLGRHRPYNACSPTGETRLLPFKVGEKVVYPNHGVGVIEQIAHNTLNGRAEEFYLIRILSNGLKVTVPCVNADCVGLRRIIKGSDIPGVLSSLRNGRVESPRDWKFRFKQNSEKMRTGLLEDVAEVLKSLVALSNHKVLSFREKKMLERARQLLVAELAIVRNVNETTIEQTLQKILSKSGLHLPEAS
ncbi:MAG: CarD family transcriptional regulator [Acidobacteria bacterium]|nr:CarD family transcriptional regulator [Acidobacteriota bacterium]